MPFHSSGVVCCKKRGFIVDGHGEKAVECVDLQLRIGVKIR